MKMIDCAAITKMLESLMLEELFDSRIELKLFGKQLRRAEAFLFKKLLINELKNRKQVIIMIDQGKGDPYRTNVKILSGNQANAILRISRFMKSPIVCFIKEGHSDEISFAVPQTV